jgi:hypothetical protein
LKAAARQRLAAGQLELGLGLGGTSLPAAWLIEQLEDGRARQRVVILDCCFSGAFAKGSRGRAGQT